MLSVSSGSVKTSSVQSRSRISHVPILPEFEEYIAKVSFIRNRLRQDIESRTLDPFLLDELLMWQMTIDIPLLRSHTYIYLILTKCTCRGGNIENFGELVRYASPIRAKRDNVFFPHWPCSHRIRW